MGRVQMAISLRLRAVGASLMVAAMALAATAMTTAPAVAAPPPDSPGLAAARSAQQLVSSRPGFLLASPDDQFVAQPVQSSSGLNYVPYERTFRGLPVVGGDFVIVTNGA